MYLCALLINFMHRINKQSIGRILDVAGIEGLHVSKIALHLVNIFSDLFDTENRLDINKVRTKVNRILLEDVNKKSGSWFSRVRDPKTGKPQKGRYCLSITARVKFHLQDVQTLFDSKKEKGK